MSDEIRTVGTYDIWDIPDVEVRAIRYTINGKTGDWMLYPVTPCCQASGKGMEYETGVGCRACYEEVDSLYGMCWTLDELRRTVGDDSITLPEAVSA